MAVAILLGKIQGMCALSRKEPNCPEFGSSGVQANIEEVQIAKQNLRSSDLLFFLKSTDIYKGKNCFTLGTDDSPVSFFFKERHTDCKGPPNT